MQMEYSPKQIEAVGHMVSAWRLQEYITLPFYTIYVYLCLTTLDEEVSNIVSKGGRTAKVLFASLKYGTLLQIVLKLIIAFPTYLDTGPETCKVMNLVTIASLWLTTLAAEVSFGLCVSALLRLGRRQLLCLIALCSSTPICYLVLCMTCYIRVAAEPRTSLDQELGYACSIPPSEVVEASLPGNSVAILSYLHFARALIFIILAIVVFFVTRRRHGGHLMKAIARDGGIYYFVSAVVRLLLAIVSSPTIFAVESAMLSPFLSVTNCLNAIIIPLIAQRFLLRLKTIDSLEPQSVASEILFAQNPISSSDSKLDSIA